MERVRSVLRDRMALWLHRCWYDTSRVPPYVLRICSGAYAYASELILRRRLYQLLSLPRPNTLIWSVTNVTVGGNAKTPMTLYLARQAQERGIRVAIISRGYGRKMGAQRVCLESARVTPGESAETVGDEPSMMASLTEVPVFCVDDPVQFLSDYGRHYALWIADDLWSRLHYWAEAWWMKDGAGYGNGYLLPAGPMRFSSTWEHDAVRANVNLPDQACFYPVLRRIEGIAGSYTPESWPFAQVTLVTGIARPENVMAVLKAQWGERVAIDCIPFRDHASWDASQTEGLACVLITQKDAARLSYQAPNIYVLVVDYVANARLTQRVREALNRVLLIRNGQVDL